MSGEASRRAAAGICKQALAFLFPPICLACSRIEGHDSLDLGLCRRCHSLLTPAPRNACALCGRPLAGEPAAYRCGHCHNHPQPFQRLVWGWSYQPPFDAVIHGLKFGRLEYLGDLLAGALAVRYASDLADIDVVVPVPLHWRRRLARGYNQATLIARPLAQLLPVTFCNGLRRVRPTHRQTQLDRSRRALNVQGAFQAHHSLQLAGRHVLLVDDVFTTGATLAAAARALLEKDVRQVTALTGGRTPDAGDPYPGDTVS